MTLEKLRLPRRVETMSAQTKSPDLTQGSTRPSFFTHDSVFGPLTPKILHPDDQLEMASQPTISGRLFDLAASTFAVEEDGLMSSEKQDKIWKALKLIEECIEDRDGEQKEEESQEDEDVARVIDNEEDDLEEIRLHEIHASLAATVGSMRERQQEQRHLHQLAIQKLEAVAQTCLAQQKQLDDMNRQVQELREENQNLGGENDTLKDHVAELKSQATQKEVAVHAMSTAVTGLEGWINHSPTADPYRTQSAGQTPRRGRVVVRGQGRFRGRYFVDDPDGEVVLDGQDTVSDARDLHEGVKSWLKGFRDVEEELQRESPTRLIRSKETSSDLLSADNDWGDFETVSGA